MRNPYPEFVWFFGTAEDTSSDPLRLGRVRVRATGFHSSSANKADLPYALVLNGGAARINPGQMVFGFFLDGEEAQQPIIMGLMGGATTSAQVFNKAVKTIQIKSPIGTADAKEPSTPEPSTPTPLGSAIKGGVYVGDSIAVGLGGAAKRIFPPSTIEATGGRNTKYILEKHSGKFGSIYTVIAAGTNDGLVLTQNGQTEKNLRNLRASIKSPKVIFIVPYTNPKNAKGAPIIIKGTPFVKDGKDILRAMQIAAEKVRKVAAEKGDITIELDKYPTTDGFHPSSYDAVVKDIEKLVGKSG